MRTAVDVAIVDLGLLDGHGSEVIAQVLASHPNAMVLTLTASVDEAELARAVEAGAAGILHKSASVAEIVAGVRRLADGDWMLTPVMVVRLLNVARRRDESSEVQQALGQLTAREREVLQALADGLDSKEIAARLKISVDMQRTHMVNILAKLRLHTRLQALVFAVRHGAVTIK